LEGGVARLRDLLAATGMKLPATRWGAILSLALRRARLRLRGLGFRAREAKQMPASLLARADLCWSVGSGLAMVDVLRALDYQTRNLILSLEAGDPYRIARALTYEAA